MKYDNYWCFKEWKENYVSPTDWIVITESNYLYWKLDFNMLCRCWIMCIITSLSVEKHICKTDKYLQHEPENEN